MSRKNYLIISRYLKLYDVTYCGASSAWKKSLVTWTYESKKKLIKEVGYILQKERLEPSSNHIQTSSGVNST